MPNGLKDTTAQEVEPLTVDDVNQIAEGIEEFIMNGDRDVDDIWQPYVDQLRAQRHEIAAVAELFAMLKAHGPKACSCRLQPFVDGPVPCPTCQVATVIAKVEGRP